jgi:hypothetical protein
MKTIQKELSDWLRPVSALTAFAKSIRNEDGAQDDPSKAAKGEYVDPLADFDFDELPADQQERLKKLQTDHRAQYDEKARLEQKRLETEAFARKQQSRADSLESIVRRHNLADGPAGGGNPVSADAKRIADLQAKLEADGLKPDAAAGYAKMLSTAGDLERQRIYADLAPLIGEVGILKANNELTAASVRFKSVFDVPELNKQIRDNVQLLVEKGQPVDEKTVTHLVSMAWGQYALANPDKLGTPKGDDVTRQNHQLPTLGNQSVTNGGHRNDPTGGNQNGPRVTQPETLTIMSNLKNFFEADLPSSKKGSGKK